MNAAKKTATLGILLAIALALSFLENSLLPLPILIPGVKIGLANIVTLFAILQYGLPEALFVALARAAFVGLFSGSLSVFFFSALGGLLSCLAMRFILCFSPKIFSPLGVSAAGGFFHNLGQVIAAILFLKSPSYLYYFPILAVFGVLFGFLTGALYFLTAAALSKFSFWKHAQK